MGSLVGFKQKLAKFRQKLDFGVQVLASVPVDAMALQEILLAGLGFVIRMEVSLFLELGFAVSERTIIAIFA